MYIYQLCFRYFDEPWEMARKKQDEIYKISLFSAATWHSECSFPKSVKVRFICNGIELCPIHELLSNLTETGTIQ